MRENDQFEQQFELVIVTFTPIDITVCKELNRFEEEERKNRKRAWT